jgi:hypothetical protein
LLKYENGPGCSSIDGETIWGYMGPLDSDVNAAHKRKL